MGPSSPWAAHAEIKKNMPIADFKADYKVCGGCFCTNNYCLSPDSCCQSDLQVFLCCGSDGSCLPVVDNVPKTCSILPCCFVYPKFGCLPVAKELLSDDAEALAKIPERKHDFRMCSGCCLGICAGNNYCFAPFTCCMDNGSTFLCLGHDCSFPCNEDIPSTCGICLPGLIAYPSFGCCPSVKELFPDMGGAPGGAQTMEAGPEAQQA